jgi:hypothetical protein
MTGSKTLTFFATSGYVVENLMHQHVRCIEKPQSRTSRLRQSKGN